MVPSLRSLISVLCPRSIASYDTREDEQTGVGPGDALRDIHEYLTSLAPGEGDVNNHADNESDAERPLLDTDSAHEDESQHKAFVRRRTMTVHVHSSYVWIHTPIRVPGCNCEPQESLTAQNKHLKGSHHLQEVMVALTGAIGLCWICCLCSRHLRLDPRVHILDEKAIILLADAAGKE